jgi:hypothetical protein
MSQAPIFVLGCHRSGTSAVAGLLVHACGVSMGELMPATDDNPLGYFEAIGVVDAHRGLLAQMERDWSCPPAEFRVDSLDLSALGEQVAVHRELPGVWAMKDPRSMFLLPAWSALGVDQVRLVAVARPPADVISSLVSRDGLREDDADAIVDAYLGRLVEIAEQVPLPVIRYPGDDQAVVDQVRELAAALDLPWNDQAAHEFFSDDLVRNRAHLVDNSPAFDSLLAAAKLPTSVPEVSLSSLRLSSAPGQPLPTHLAVRHALQRNELWRIAEFSASSKPIVAELTLEGARPSGRGRPGVTLHQIAVAGHRAVGAALLDRGLRPHGVIAHHLLAGLTAAEAEHFFRSVYVATHPMAELVVDVPDPEGPVLAGVRPEYISQPEPPTARAAAEASGWDHLTSTRVSPGRTGMVFRKRLLVDSELVPVVTDLLASATRLEAVERRLTAVETPPAAGDDAERKRADAAVAELEKLRSRRSVRFALAVARLFQPIVRAFRSWTS